MRVHRARARRCWWSTIRRTRPPRRSISLSTSEVVAFAKEHKVWVLSDLAYAEIYFDDKPTALDPAGAGRQGRRGRVHLAVARPIRWPAGGSASRSATRQLIAALTRVKSYLDYGAFTPIQAAACAALNGPQDIVEKNRELYTARRDVLVESFGRAGWDIPAPRASMFAWAPLPPALQHLGSLEFSKQLLDPRPGRGRARRRLRRGRRGLCAHRAGRERAAPPPGGAQREALSPVDGGQRTGRRRRTVSPAGLNLSVG